MKSKDLFPAIFSRHAADYKQRLDEIMARGEARGRQRVIDALDVHPGMRVVDLACGPGTLSEPLAQRVAPGGEVVGVDLAPGMIDAAACGHGLQFVPDLGRALREAHRVLRRGSRFAASVPVDGGHRAWSALDRVVDRWLPPAPQPTDRSATRSVVGDAGAFRGALRDAGFGQADVEVVEEKVVWDSAEQLVERAMSWWDLASRVDTISPEKRQRFVDEAVESVRSEHPGRIETFARNHVAVATA